MPTHLRVATAGDAEAIAAIYTPYVLNTTISFETTPPNAAELARRMDNGGKFPWLLATEDDRVMAYAYAGRFGTRAGYNWAAEVSIYTHEAARHKGMGRKLYTALLELLKQQGIRTAWGIIALPNPASVGFHTRMGFTRQGTLENIGYKLGEPVSVGYFGKALLSVMENPPLPLPFAELGEVLVRQILDEAAGITP